MTFDTLAVATELKDAGFPPEQAEALARAWSHVASGELATRSDLLGVKSDLSETRSELKGEIASLRSELKGETASLRSELREEISDVRSDVKILRWMIGFSLALSLLILGKLFAVH